MDMDKRPGAPRPDEVQSDSIELFWDHPEIISPEKPVKEYEIRYMELPNSEWRRYSEFPDRACVRIKGLKSKSSYTFKVRAVYDDFEGPYSLESIEITTKATLASELFPFTVNAKEGEEGTPSIQCLLKTEIENSRNEKARTKKIEIGKPPAIAAATEKTILLVGETGSGKSTLVDGFINYIAGVNYEDHFRLTLVDLEEEEKGKSQATSQTEWVTCYTIHPSPGSRIPYTLNIIDTPGFGDTRGLDRDKEIFEQLRQLFSAKGEKGVVFIDAACFVLKAPDARLTPNQMYIFTSVLSLFGKDIKENMCALITFADSKKPQVLSAMKEAKLPVEVWYLFNNSGLFANNDSTSHAQIYWEMVSESFQKFFKGLENMTTKSLQQTKEVLENRKKMETTISNLQPLIDAGLKKQEEVRKEMLISESHESDIAAKRNFEYTVEETHMRKSDLQNGQFATNCPNCKVTCHHNCTGTSNALNYLCSAMDWFGNCTVCVGKCGFLEHKNEQSIYRFVTENVTKTYADRLKEYEAAKKKKLTHEQYIEEMKKDLSVLETTVSSMMAEVHQCKTILSEIALQPNVISLKEHIDLMIQSEERKKNEGYKERIAILKSHQERYDLGKKLTIRKQTT